MANDLHPQTVVSSPGARYEIIRTLSHGGFGIVYLALMHCPGKQPTVVALKEFFLASHCERDEATQALTYSNPVKTRVESAMKDFQSEALRLKQFCSGHTNVVNVIEVFEANRSIYYSMEYIEGESLKDYVERRGRLSVNEMMLMMIPIVNAVAGLHRQQITHLDIKPSNVMLATDATGQIRPVLIDFGLSKHYSDSGQPTSTINTQGVSDGFSPVEQYGGITRFSPTADVYALGATILFCLTGMVPPRACDLTPERLTLLIDGNVPASYRQISSALLRAMDYMPAKRQQSAGQLQQELTGPSIAAPAPQQTQPILPASDDTVISPTPNQVPGPITYRSKNNTTKTVLTVAIIVVLLAIAATVAYFLTSRSTKAHVEVDDEDVGFVEKVRSSFDEPIGASDVTGFKLKASSTAMMPDKKIGADAWPTIKEYEIRNGATPYDAEIFFYPEPGVPPVVVSAYFDIVIRPNGQIVGRYDNPDIVKLDVNGVVNPSTGDITILLGHESQQSKMRLHYEGMRYSDDAPYYVGIWGKKNKETHVTFYPR
ncbi:MAG: serine/threonine protein kinase [Bacteroides sp.]|nr:serine/threonine protein kinase [Bacteroides sp.]MCM1413514.1 serine/threonine protein kinase [Bacteroides sp.]MCM1471068.1 serine/threonine protein kinase [Bacteroides sp.]